MARRRRVWPWIVGGVLAVVVIATVAVYWYMRPLLLTGTGYAAHNACALQFISERSDHEADLPPNPLVPYLRTDVGDSYAEVSVLGVLAKQTAWFTEGYGCTLADERPDFAPAVEITASNPIAEAAAPTEVDDAVAAALNEAFAEGLGTRAVVVVKDGELVAERYADGFTADTPQLGWSMSKSVTSLLVGILAEQGQVDVLAQGLLPIWKDDDRREITLDDLMRMTSGLAWDETYDLGTPITKMLYTEPDMGMYAAEQRLQYPVGTVEEYSSGSTNIVCLDLRNKTGSDANLPRELLLAPLGLSSAVWEPDASGTPVCASYLWATPRDWAAIGQFVLDGGSVGDEALLPGDWLEEVTSPVRVDSMQNGNYGAGWWLNEQVGGSLVHPDLPPDTFWASGHDGQYMYIVPSEGLVVLRMGFSPGLGGDEIGMSNLVEQLIAALSQE